jgi:hypothetical protein
MEIVYLAYFDFMGFKEFINNNDDETLMRRMGHIFRDIETSLGLGKYQKPRNGVILADLSKSKLNCLNISDTVLIWTNDCSQTSLIELIKVAYHFNFTENGYNFPVRGSVVKGKIRVVTGKNTNSEGGSYSVQCLYGKAMIDAHIKAENQNWAGTVIEKKVVEDLKLTKTGNQLLNETSIIYNVPYKTGVEKDFVFKLKKGKLNETALTNSLSNIDRIFEMDNKGINESVETKMNNTKQFIINCKDIE